MATVKSTLYKQQIGDVSDKSLIGQQGGKIRVLRFTHTLAAELGASDVLKFGVLPKGALVIDAKLTCPDLGTTGTASLGWAASAELDSAGSAVEAASTAGLIASHILTDAAGEYLAMTGQDAGFLKLFSAAVDVQLNMSVATDVGNGLVIKGYVKYVAE